MRFKVVFLFFVPANAKSPVLVGDADAPDAAAPEMT